MFKLNELYLKEHIKKINVMVLDSCTSTNLILKDSNYEEDTLLVTNEQTNGIGRVNREFVSNKDKGIYMSLLTFKKIPSSYISKVTAITSVIVSNCIEKYIKKKTKIKWVNDIYLDDFKICGILVQSKFSNNKLDKLIIGIGINLYNQTFDNELSKKANNIEDLTGVKINRNFLIVDIINALNEALDNVMDDSYMIEYRNKSNLINREVIILLKEEEVKVKVIDINLEGELVVLLDNKPIPLRSTEVIKVLL